MLSRGAPSGLLTLALLFATAGCGGGTGSSTGIGVTPSAPVASSPTPTPTPTPSPSPSPKPSPKPSPTKLPFLWALVLNGGSSFAGVTGAPVGSVCSAKAFLKSGKDISGSALTPRTVTNAATGVSWSDTPEKLFSLPSPAPSPGSEAYWEVSCRNDAFNPPTGSTTKAFQTP